MNLRPFLQFELTPAQKVNLADRLLAQAKTHVDYGVIERTFDALEERYVTSIASAIDDARSALLDFVESEFRADESSMDWVVKLKLRSWNPIRSELREMAGASFASGRVTFRREATGSTDFAVSVTPREAAKFMDERMFWVSGVMRDSLTKKAQSVLAQAIKNGEAGPATSKKLRELFTPYVGGEVSGKVVTPARLETIVRTNVTEAYNQGRLTELHHPATKGLIEGIRYSATIDERTTEICEYLDGQVFREDEDEVDRIAPPNHFNCRSVLVPVVVGEEVDRYSGQGELNKANSMVKSGFGGDIMEP